MLIKICPLKPSFSSKSLPSSWIPFHSSIYKNWSSIPFQGYYWQKKFPNTWWVQERLHHLLHLPHHHHKAIPSLSIVIMQSQLVLLVQLLTWIFFNHCQSVLMGFLPILSWDIIIFCCSPDQSEGKPSVRIASLLKIYSPY